MALPIRSKPFAHAFSNSPTKIWHDHPLPLSPPYSTGKPYPNAPPEHYGSSSPISVDSSDTCGFPQPATHPHPLDTHNLSSPPTSADSSPISPRTAMLRSLLTKQAFQSLAPHSNSHSQPHSPPCAFAAVPGPRGIETCGISALSPAGTMLSYTGGRGVESGLLAVKPLTEAQVAEYRFWQACGRRACPFGCGNSDEGELEAGKRLFA